MIIYVNGRYVKEEEAVISPFDHGFLYGMGLFETLRIYKGHPFLLDDHLERLQRGLDNMYIEMQIDKEEIKAILRQLLERNALQHARVRINISAGTGAVGLPGKPYQEPLMIVFISPLQEPINTLEEKPAILLKMPRNTPETSVRMKSHHYGNNIAAKMELVARPDAEGIFLTEEGYVSEAITSNLFWVKNQIIYTPAVDTGILPGITRQLVVRLAKQMGFEVEEGCYPLVNLEEAEEVFITNSIQEVVAVNELEGHVHYEGAKGEVTNRLFKEYQVYRTQLWTSKNINVE